MLFTRKMKPETHDCWVVLTRRKAMGGLGIGLVQSPKVTNTAGAPWQPAQGAPGTAWHP